jgi:hypothetical protein
MVRFVGSMARFSTRGSGSKAWSFHACIIFRAPLSSPWPGRHAGNLFGAGFFDGGNDDDAAGVGEELTHACVPEGQHIAGILVAIRVDGIAKELFVEESGCAEDCDG